MCAHVQIHTKIPDNSSHPDKDLCSAAASFGLWSPTPFLFESSSYCRDLYFCGPLQSCYDSCGADECDLSLIRRYWNRALVMEVFPVNNQWITAPHSRRLQIQMNLPSLVLHALGEHSMVLWMKMSSIVSNRCSMVCEATGGQWCHALARWHRATKELPETTTW